MDEVENGLVTKSGAARKYEVSASVIDRWIMKALRAESEKLKTKVGELTMLVEWPDLAIFWLLDQSVSVITRDMKAL